MGKIRLEITDDEDKSLFFQLESCDIQKLETVEPTLRTFLTRMFYALKEKTKDGN